MSLEGPRRAAWEGGKDEAPFLSCHAGVLATLFGMKERSTVLIKLFKSFPPLNKAALNRS